MLSAPWTIPYIEMPAEPHPDDVIPIKGRPLLKKVSRPQRKTHILKKLGEFAALDLDSVDPECQKGLVARKLAILRSLLNPVLYRTGSERCEECTLELVGLSKYKSFLLIVSSSAESHMFNNMFRTADETLDQFKPVLLGVIEKTTIDYPDLQTSAASGLLVVDMSATETEGIAEIVGRNSCVTCVDFSTEGPRQLRATTNGEFAQSQSEDKPAQHVARTMPA